MLTVSPNLAETIAVGATTAAFAMVMEQGRKYRLVSSTACYVNRAATVQAATAGAQTPSATSSIYVPANAPFDMDGLASGRVSVIRASADGFASLAPLTWH